MQLHKKSNRLVSFLVLSNLVLLAGAGYALYLNRPDRPSSAPVSQAPAVDLPLPVPAKALTVVAAGDIACMPGKAVSAKECRMAETAALVGQIQPDRILALGDLQYEKGELKNYQQVFDVTWGKYKTILHSAPGNHEYATAGASGYYDYFGPQAGERGKGYYSFDVGGWHFVALNSNCAAVKCAAGSEQEQWLRQDLAASKAKCTVAFWHHARLSSATHGASDQSGTQALWQALYEAGADVVLTGHEHIYERFSPLDASLQPDAQKGLRQFVVGTGGRSLYPVRTVKPGSEVRNDQAFGVLKLELFPDTYKWSWVGEPGSVFSDSGQASCH